MKSAVIPGTWLVLTSVQIHFAYGEEEKEQKSSVLVKVVEYVRIQEKKKLERQI